MDYIIVPTSKCLYQKWQLKLLQWSTNKVKQKGKLIFLVSHDHNHFSETLSFDYPNAEVIDLPDWAKEWEVKNGEWWGGIPNKYESVKWLVENKQFNPSDRLLFLDPDMIFTEPVDLYPKTNEVIGQKWNDFHPLVEYPSNSIDSIMYPFAITFYTLKKIVKDYKEYCIDIRNKTNRWESEMWGLHYALEKNNIKINHIEDLGRCTIWNEDNSLNTSKLYHFPNKIESKSKENLFFKQDYTVNLNQKIEINKGRNTSDRILLSNIDQERTDYIYESKWDTPHLFKFYDGSKGYLCFQPWPGGFNNIRMSLEQAVCLAYLTNRTLVLPPTYSMYLTEGETDFSHYFNTSNLGVSHLTFKEFTDLKQLPNNIESLKEITKTLEYNSTSNVINFEKIPIPSSFSKGRNVINSEDIFDNSEIIYLDKNLLGSFHQTFYTKHESSLKQLVGKYVTYRNDLRDIAWQFINFLEDKSYYSIHVRRNDFQFKELFIPGDELYNNIKDKIPQGSKLYISTDSDDLTLFTTLKQNYQVTFYNDLSHQLSIPEFSKNWIPIIEQLICSRGIKFISNEKSTLSSYIYRLRSYMNDIEYKSYYLNAPTTDPSTSELFHLEKNYQSNWVREYKDISFFDDSITLVSIASYRDTQIFDTLHSLYSNVSNPNKVKVIVHLQDIESEYVKLLDLTYPNLEVIFTPFNQTKGVVWARNEIKDKYNNESYFLQVDSHSRFKENWDLILQTQLKSIKGNKVVISTFPNHFDVPDPEKNYLNLPHNTPLVIDRFIHQSDTDNRLKAKNLPSLKDYEVVDTKWVSAGFLFSTGNWVKEIQVPRQMVYGGEEDCQTHLTYLKGWDIKIVSEATIWHNYNYKTVEEEPYRIHNNEYHQTDNAPEEINNILFNNSYKRSLNDLENYLDISFKHPIVLNESSSTDNNVPNPDKENTIFVSVASYRDKELIKTIKDCLSKAKHPERVKIGVCWQYDETEDISGLDNIPQVHIEKIYWEDVKGSVCWARKLIQDKFFTDEQYYFQVDSHTLFEENWDEILINMYSSLPNPKSLISIGPPYYYDLRTEGGLPPEDNCKVRYKGGILFDDELKIQKLDSVGGIHFMYGFLPSQDTSSPILSRHISAALLFTTGQWVKDVPYDDDLYFHGEEPTLTLRSYTHGYDLYNPNKFVAWHLKYLFPQRKRHWNTFPQDIIDKFVSKSNTHYQKIITGEEQGIYGIGKERTIKEWEIYSGVSFKDLKAHPKVFKGYIPNPITIDNLEEWENL